MSPGPGQVAVEGVSLSPRTGERRNRRVGDARVAGGSPASQRSAGGGSCGGVSGLPFPVISCYHEPAILLPLTAN